MQEEVITKLLQRSNPYSNFTVANIPSTQEEITATLQKKMIDAGAYLFENKKTVELQTYLKDMALVIPYNEKLAHEELYKNITC